MALTIKRVGGPKNCSLPATGPVGMLGLQRHQAAADICCNSRHYFNQKTKSINTTHLRQNNIYDNCSLRSEGLKGRGVKSPSNKLVDYLQGSWAMLTVGYLNQRETGKKRLVGVQL